MDNLDEQIKVLDDKLQKDVEKLTLQYIEDIGNLHHCGTNHGHKCVFEMIYPKRHAKKCCIDYLHTKNMKRDKCFSCCDYADEFGCRYMKMIFFNEKEEIISII